MDALAPLQQLKELEATQRGASSLPGWSRLPWPAGREEFIKSKPQQEEDVDEITAWWQKALGTKAVLGQASNRPPPGPRAPIPKLLWNKPEIGRSQETTVVEATPRAIEEKGASNPGTQGGKGRLGMDRRLTGPGRLNYWSGVIVNGAVFFLAVVFLRFAVAVFEAIRAGWSRRVRAFVLRTNPLPGEDSQ
jgi:hypothetical protein